MKINLLTFIQHKPYPPIFEFLLVIKYAFFIICAACEKRDRENFREN